MTLPPVTRVSRIALRHGEVAGGERMLAAEVPVALTYNGGAYAVMMATPADLEDFAVGFSVTEGIVASPSDIEKFEVVDTEIGIELRMWLADLPAERLAQRRRTLAGPTGCGLCGIDSLAEAMRPVPRVAAGQRFQASDILAAVRELAPRQEINRQTRAVHAAAFWRHGAGLVSLREDVGRHNALDKLAGALLRDNVPALSGLVLLTSRVSVEMVQKAAMMQAPVVVAVSAPTALALKIADEAGITLAAIARDDGFEIFTHPDRIVTEAATHVA